MLVVSVNGLLDHKRCKGCFWQQIVKTRLEKPTVCKRVGQSTPLVNGAG